MDNLKVKKEAMGYVDKPILPVCKNCRHFTVNTKRDKNGMSVTHKNLCDKGGFEVLRSASCYKFEVDKKLVG